MTNCILCNSYISDLMNDGYDICDNCESLNSEGEEE